MIILKIDDLNLEGELLQNVQKLIQSETDRVRTEYSQKIKELEQYKPKEKSEEEKALEDRIKALEDKERAINERERLNKLSDGLKSKGVSGELAQYLNVGEDIDLETYLDEIVKVIGEQATFKPNKSHSDKANSNITKNDFKNMTYTERMNLYNTNRELYNILTK